MCLYSKRWRHRPAIRCTYCASHQVCRVEWKEGEKSECERKLLIPYTGNFDGLGEIRKRELDTACQVIIPLSAPPDNTRGFPIVILSLPSHLPFHAPVLQLLGADSVQCIECPLLQDGMKVGEGRTQHLTCARSSFTHKTRAHHLFHPQNVWGPAAVATRVNTFVAQHQVDTLVTFDQGGVSGHPVNGGHGWEGFMDCAN